MKKILITGVGGLLGSRLADWIIENTKYDVIGIDDLSGGFSENINKKIKFYKCLKYGHCSRQLGNSTQYWPSVHRNTCQRIASCLRYHQ